MNNSGGSKTKGKEASTRKKTGGQRISKEYNIQKDPKDDLYPLSKSATDPSNSASPIKSKGRSFLPTSVDDDHLFAVTDTNNDLSLSLNQPPSNEKKLNIRYILNQSAESKHYQERPSFKVERLLTHHLNSNQSQDSKEERVLDVVCQQTSSLSNLDSSLKEAKNNEFFDCEEQPLLNFEEPPSQSDKKGNVTPQETVIPDCLQTNEFTNLNVKNFDSEISNNAVEHLKEAKEADLQCTTEVVLSEVNSFSRGVFPEANSLTCDTISIIKETETSELPKTEFIPDNTTTYSCEQLCNSSHKDSVPILLDESTALELELATGTVQTSAGVNSETHLISQEEIDASPDSFCCESEINTEEQNSEDKSGYLEFVFEDSKKHLKPPPKFLGRRNQSASKKRSKNRSRSNNKEKLQRDSFTSSGKELTESSSTARDLDSGDPTHIENINRSSSPRLENKPLPDTEKRRLIETEKLNITSVEASDTDFKEKKIDQISPFIPVVRKEENIVEGTKVPLSLELNREKEISQIQEKGEKDSQDRSVREIKDCNNSLSSDPIREKLSKDSDNERINVTSISCYGNEEFEILGDEANKLAEELRRTESSVVTSIPNMEEKRSSDDRSYFGSFESLYQQSESSKCEGKRKSSLNKTSKGSMKKESLILQVSDSEAGPDIATGLTSSDLKCASQFFKEAAELECQIRRNIAASVGSLNDFTSDATHFASENDVYSSSAKGGPLSSPPHEERSAPEGTSSPDPRSLEDSEVRNRLQRSPECSSTHEVNELLKKQALEFEEKLLRQGIVAAEKEKELHELLKEEQKQMQKVTASRDALLKLVEQYKGMLAALVDEKEKANGVHEDKVRALDAEKQQAIEDLNNVEAAFSDVHRKYERTKQIVDSLRRNEETLRNAVADYEEKLLKQERKFGELQKHAEEKVKLANEEFEALRRSNDQEMTKMGALLKKAEMKIISLQEALDRKARENQELTQLCDDLISKVGS